MDKESAISALGSDLAQRFHSLVADMRDATYLDELADKPVVFQNSGPATLRFSLGSNSWLEAEPVGQFPIAEGNWGQSHRLKLLHIYKEGAVLT